MGGKKIGLDILFFLSYLLSFYFLGKGKNGPSSGSLLGSWLQKKLWALWQKQNMKAEIVRAVNFMTDFLLCEGPYLLSGLWSIRHKDQPEMGPHLVCFGVWFKEEGMAESRKVTRGSWGEWILALLLLQHHYPRQSNNVVAAFTDYPLWAKHF